MAVNHENRGSNPLGRPNHGEVPERLNGAVLKTDGPSGSRRFDSCLHRHTFRDRLNGRTTGSELVNLGSNPSPGATFALLMELVYILGLEPRFWEFDSPRGHQLRRVARARFIGTVSKADGPTGHRGSNPLLSAIYGSLT